MQDRLDRMPEAMGVRRETVEHPFGTLKAWMGATHFLTRTLDKVRTEMSLHVLAYNLKRMIAIFGAGPLRAAIRTDRLAQAARTSQSTRIPTVMAEKHSAPPTSYDAFFHGLGQNCSSSVGAGNGRFGRNRTAVRMKAELLQLVVQCAAGAAGKAA